MALNTDLALESFNDVQKAEKLSGVESAEYTDSAAELKITEINVLTQEAAERLAKPIGRYITLESETPLGEYTPCFEERCRAVCEALKKLCSDGPTLFVGLGNRKITPDSLGPLTADRIFATRHIKRLAKEIDSSDLSETSVFSAGVMAQTGFETAELAEAVCAACSPAQVIVCDALACCEPTHMGRTIQLCSTGISPGSGVENSRQELSEKTLGVPVAAVGIPLVSRAMSEDQRFSDLLVTPKAVDRLAEQGSAIIAGGVNMLLHPSLTLSEIASLTL